MLTKQRSGLLAPPRTENTHTYTQMVCVRAHGLVQARPRFSGLHNDTRATISIQHDYRRLLAHLLCLFQGRVRLVAPLTHCGFLNRLCFRSLVFSRSFPVTRRAWSSGFSGGPRRAINIFRTSFTEGRDSVTMMKRSYRMQVCALSLPETPPGGERN